MSSCNDHQSSSFLDKLFACFKSTTATALEEKPQKCSDPKTITELDLSKKVLTSATLQQIAKTHTALKSIQLAGAELNGYTYFDVKAITECFPHHKGLKVYGTRPYQSTMYEPLPSFFGPYDTAMG
jgi:hypothetical protein